jgi:hypothetical protein
VGGGGGARVTTTGWILPPWISVADLSFLGVNCLEDPKTFCIADPEVFCVQIVLDAQDLFGFL